MRIVSSVGGILTLLVATQIPLRAAPILNEFMASNLSTYPDNCDFEDYSDWIELYNPAATNVSLNNYFLTDKLSEPFKWLIPNGAVMTPNSYLMFRADGHNAAPGQTRVRGYYPWGTTFVTRRYHTGFKISASGEELGLLSYRVAAAGCDADLDLGGLELPGYGHRSGNELDGDCL